MTVRDIVLYAHDPVPLRKKCKTDKGFNRLNVMDYSINALG